MKTENNKPLYKEEPELLILYIFGITAAIITFIHFGIITF